MAPETLSLILVLRRGAVVAVVAGVRRAPTRRLLVRAGVATVALGVLVALGLVLVPKRRCLRVGFVPAGCSTVVVVVVTVVPPA